MAALIAAIAAITAATMTFTLPSSKHDVHGRQEELRRLTAELNHCLFACLNAFYRREGRVPMTIDELCAQAGDDAMACDSALIPFLSNCIGPAGEKLTLTLMDDGVIVIISGTTGGYQTCQECAQNGVYVEF